MSFVRYALKVILPFASLTLAACGVVPTGPNATADITSAPAGTAPQTAAGSAASISAVISLTNQARATAGAAPLTENPALDRAAAILCAEIAQTGVWSHTQAGTAYPLMQDRVNSVGYAWRALGENLAMTVTADPQHLVNAWMNSTDHRANILNVSFTEIGVAQRQSGTNVCSVQVFGAR